MRIPLYRWKKWGIFVLLLCWCSCNRYYVSVRQQKIDATCLASYSVGSPDPRLEHPPQGQRLVLDWLLPAEMLEQEPKVVLHAIFWNHTQKTFEWPIIHRLGYTTFSLLNDEYTQTGGLLTYMAQIITREGTVFREWKHQLWVRLITLDESPPVPRPE